MTDFYKDMQPSPKSGVARFDHPNYWSSHDDYWIRLCPKEPKKTVGWRFHISVDPSRAPEAFNLIVEELLADRQVPHRAKAATPHLLHSFSSTPRHQQAGKTIVLHTVEGVSPDHYKKLLARIEEKLGKAGITPGVAPKGDRTVPGSKYLHYRYGRGANGKYASAGNDYNPLNVDDPYYNFSAGNLGKSLFLGKWQDGKMDIKTETGIKEVDAARMPLVGLTATEIRGLEENLRNAGIKAERRFSHSLQQEMVYIKDNDATRIIALQKAHNKMKPR